MADVVIGTHAGTAWWRRKVYSARPMVEEHKHRVSTSLSFAQCCLRNSSCYSIQPLPQLFERCSASVPVTFCLPDGWLPGPQWACYVYFFHVRLNSFLREVVLAFALPSPLLTKRFLGTTLVPGTRAFLSMFYVRNQPRKRRIRIATVTC